MQTSESVWVFCGVKGQFPSGVFKDLSLAEDWIPQWSLTGVLTKYPINEGVYEWATRTGYFTPSSPHQQTPEFIGKFSSAMLDHHHYEDGRRADT